MVTFVAATVTLWMTTAVARHSHDVFNAHAASEQCDGQEEADHQNRQGHEDPRHGLEAAVAEPLEDTRAEYANQEPPDHGTRVRRQDVIQYTGHRNQKNCCGGLTETNIHANVHRSIVGAYFLRGRKRATPLTICPTLSPTSSSPTTA